MNCEISLNITARHLIWYVLRLWKFIWQCRRECVELF